MSKETYSVVVTNKKNFMLQMVFSVGQTQGLLIPYTEPPKEYPCLVTYYKRRDGYIDYTSHSSKELETMFERANAIASGKPFTDSGATLVKIPED